MCKILNDYGQLQNLIAGMFGTDGNNQNWKANVSSDFYRSFAFGEKKYGDIWPINNNCRGEFRSIFIKSALILVLAFWSFYFIMRFVFGVTKIEWLIGLK